jgi:hypothetical protein
MAKFLEFIKKNYFFIFLIAVIVLSVLLFNTCSTLKNERADRKYQEKQDAQNYSAKVDSITVVYDKKLKAYISSKDEYVVQELSDLKKYNAELAAEIKKVKGDVIDAINSKAEVNIGRISTLSKVEVLDEKTNHYGLNFTSEYKDPGFTQTINGTSRFFVEPDLKTRKWSIKADSTIFNTNLTTISVTYGSRLNKDKKYEVFAISPSPKVKFIDLTGAYIIENQPKPATVKLKRFGVGPYIGYGLNNFNSPKFGMSIGVAAHYDILQFRF